MKTLVKPAYADVRGFNYVPSYAATIWDVIDHFDPEVWDRELGFAKRLDANTLQVWTDVLSFQRDEQRFLAAWHQAFALARRHDLRLVVGLANRWVDELYWYGGVNLTDVLSGTPTSEYRRYVTTFVSTFRDEPTIRLWDLCNEPFHQIVPAEHSAELQRRELAYWTEVAGLVREARPSQPLTMAMQRRHPYDHHAVDALVDVLSAHLYRGAWDGAEPFGALCDEAVAAANAVGKPLIASEICPGSEDAKRRRDMIRVSVEACERRGIGWFAWQLMAGRIVSSRWDRVDRNCADGDRAVMYFLEADGTPRPGHDVTDWRPETSLT